MVVKHFDSPLVSNGCYNANYMHTETFVKVKIQPILKLVLSRFIATGLA